jgi:hypothetical protein
MGESSLIFSKQLPLAYRMLSLLGAVLPMGNELYALFPIISIVVLENSQG